MTTLDRLLGVYGLPPALGAGPGDPPSFTVIVRTQGRRPRSLAEALASIAAQRDAAFDVVVVVHADESVATTVRALVETLPDGDRPARLTVVGVAGGGRSTPLNAGLDHVTGTHFCFLDDDDLARPGWLSGFAAAATDAPGAIVRAVTLVQAWTTDGGDEPARATGPIERPFPDRFDLLAHMSLNLTPICALAFPRAAIDPLGLRFSDDLPVLEDWDFLMRAAMALGVVSIPDETTLYRRLDAGNADAAETVATWERAHAMVLDRLDARPVVLPAGDARRLAGTHFVTGSRSRHEAELDAARAELAELTKSPTRWARAFGRRAADAARHRIAARRR